MHKKKGAEVGSHRAAPFKGTALVQVGDDKIVRHWTRFILLPAAPANNSLKELLRLDNWRR